MCFTIPTAFCNCAVFGYMLNKLGIILDNINQYDDIITMVTEEKLDLVLICNQNSFHADSAYKVLKAGANVLVEKPIDANITKAKKLLNLSKKLNKKIFVVMQKRFDSANVFLKKCLKDKSLGKLILFTFANFGNSVS